MVSKIPARTHKIFSLTLHSNLYNLSMSFFFPLNNSSLMSSVTPPSPRLISITNFLSTSFHITLSERTSLNITNYSFILLSSFSVLNSYVFRNDRNMFQSTIKQSLDIKLSWLIQFLLLPLCENLWSVNLVMRTSNSWLAGKMVQSNNHLHVDNS